MEVRFGAVAEVERAPVFCKDLRLEGDDCKDYEFGFPDWGRWQNEWLGMRSSDTHTGCSVDSEGAHMGHVSTESRGDGVVVGIVIGEGPGPLHIRMPS